MATISRKEVEHVAHLARIRLTPEELEKFQGQLTSVIDYNANILAEVDVSGIEPTAQTTGLHNMWRDDERVESLPVKTALSQAGDRNENQFRVKKVLEEG